MHYTVFRVTNSGQILAQLLEAKRMTQGQAAIALGIRQQHVSLYLSGRRIMSADRFLLFLEKLGGEVRVKR